MRLCRGGIAVACMLGLISSIPLSLALRNGLALTPPMGWSNWEATGCNISEEIMKANTEALISKGLVDAGYNIVGIDDCWGEMTRNATGYLVENKTRFPSGLKSLGDYLHTKGLQFGIYSSAGAWCCQHTMPGSLGYEWLDAKLFAEWGVDYLKYDGCFMEDFSQVEKDYPHRFPFAPPPILRYPQMAMALNKTGRNITYLCNFPWQFWNLEKDPSMGGDWVGEFCHMWRTGGDARPGFGPAIGYVFQSEKYAKFVPSGPGRWNHLDSVEIGNNNSNVDPITGEVTSSGMTEDQEHAVFSLFAVVKSPLFIGADATKLEGHSLETYLNKEVIAIHQDPLGIRGHWINTTADGDLWMVPVSDGAAAVVLLNKGNSNITMNFTLDTIGMDSEGKGYMLRDLWKHEDVGEISGSKVYSTGNLAPTSAVMLKLTPK